MKQETLFQRLKTFINSAYPGEFNTRDMCAFVNEQSTNSTPWKRWNNNPNYSTHLYLGQLRELGCVERIRHGVYKINAPIPSWFGSYHFNGLKGKLDDPSNFYWNSLPARQKVNPWGVYKLKGAIPEYDQQLRVKYPANVEGSIEQRIAAMEDLVNEQTEKLRDIKNALIELQALADEQNQVVLRYRSEYVDRTFEVTYLGNEYKVIHTCNSFDVFDEYWKVVDYLDEEISDTEISEYLINWVQENCK